MQRSWPIRAVLAGAAGGALLVFGTGAARGDIVHLRDGSSAKGQIQATGDGWIVSGDGKTLLVHADQVAYIEATAKNRANDPEDHLASLRLFAQSASDAGAMISRYKQFIAQYPHAAASDKARADLAVWQDRLSRGLFKVGRHWLTAEEKAGIAARCDADAARAVGLMRQSRWTEAGKLLDSILADDPRHAGSLYLKGLSLYHQNQPAAARKTWERLIALLPEHAPTLNNLAVLYGRQNEPMIALGFYDRALQAAPDRREILDNIAEALAGLPEEKRDAPVTRRLVRHFNEQDAKMQAAMQRQGLFRWGAVWVTAQQMQQVKLAERQTQETLAKLQAQFDGISERVDQIDAAIEGDQSLVRRMEADSFTRDAYSGFPISYPMPPSYYQALREIKNLQAERDGRVTEENRLRQQARQALQAVPTPRYTGEQRLIEADGVPIPAAILAAVAPPPPAAPAVRAAPVAVNPAPRPAPPAAPAPPPSAPPVSAPPLVAAAPAPVVAAAGPAPLPRRTVVPPPRPSIIRLDPAEQ